MRRNPPGLPACELGQLVLYSKFLFLEARDKTLIGLGTTDFGFKRIFKLGMFNLESSDTLVNAHLVLHILSLAAKTSWRKF